jgi:hypothetical protein
MEKSLAQPVLAKFDRIADCVLDKMVGSVIDHAIIIDGSIRHTARREPRYSADRIADAGPSSGEENLPHSLADQCGEAEKTPRGPRVVVHSMPSIAEYFAPCPRHIANWTRISTLVDPREDYGCGCAPPRAIAAASSFATASSTCASVTLLPPIWRD